MVCTASDLEGWKDFPKGLRILLLDEDAVYCAELRSKLEAMEYIVTTFCNETEAMLAYCNNPEIFHVAIVEVRTSKGDWGFKFLDTAKGMPIIMTSNIHCLNTMIKCIALGAVEFLRKPLSEEKLRNIWQHVVYKAFNAGGKAVSESIKSVKESVPAMLQPKLENGSPKCKISVVTENTTHVLEHGHEQCTRSDKYPAPLTPQIKQVSRLMDDGDCQDQTNSSEKESEEHDGDSKSVETTCDNADDSLQISEPQIHENLVVKQENNVSTAGVSKLEDNVSIPNTEDSTTDTSCATENLSKTSGLNHSYKSSRKKMKVDWTPELHKKFVHAVEELGVDQAIPSRILVLMNAEGLTRHNVASHLQKYRMNKRNILPKDEDRRRLHPRDPTQMSYYPHKPIMAYPAYNYNSAMPGVYPMLGQPAGHPANIQMWTPSSYPPWKLPENWHWKPPYPALHADTWGCPVVPQPPQGGYSSYYPQTASGIHNPKVVGNGCSIPHNYSELHPADEIIDKVMKEAMSKPWLPLPLGLKLPSTEDVLAELSRQGICNIPPPINGSKETSLK